MLFYYSSTVNRMRWKEMNAHFMKHDGFRLRKRINLTAEHDWSTKWFPSRKHCIKVIQASDDMLRISFPRLRVISMKVVSYVLQFSGQIRRIMALVNLLWDPVNLATLNIHFVMKFCGSWIFSACSVVSSWGSWILNLFLRRGSLVSWILFFFCGGILRIWDPKFLLCSGILDILDLLGGDFTVGCNRPRILKFYFVIGSCGSWILIFGCGTCLLVRRR